MSTTPPSRDGLSNAEAARRLAANGPNAIAQVRAHPFALLASKFWAPVPWLLEVAVVLELLLRDDVQALVFAILLIFNAALAFAQEGRAQGALDLLRQRLSVVARVQRDGTWAQIAARELVVGDVVHIRQGDIVPADVELTSGDVELDQAALTGESRSVSAGPGAAAYSGSVVVRGEASGKVTATGSSTYFGRTAEMVRTARAPGNMEHLIFNIVRSLMSLALVVIVMVIADGLVRHLSAHALIPFVLILIIASVPVALPATFTLATALGSRELSQHNVLVTRLAAIEEAASMEVLCTDKTGTLTLNSLSVESLKPYAPFDESSLLAAAAAASSEATQDPLDLAVIAMAASRHVVPLGAPISSTPFDPALKRAEATVQGPSGPIRVIKGAPQIVGALCHIDDEGVRRDVAAMASSGARVLGVAQGELDGPLRWVGLVAMADPPREDAASLIQRLRDLGIQVVMLTGDSQATATAIASRVGINGRVASGEELRRVKDGEGAPIGGDSSTSNDSARRPWQRNEWREVYAEVLPEDKMHLIDRLQRDGIVVGMTGDGVNDAPALRKAEVGIAVSSATDVAKAASSLVLTDPGLGDIVSAVEVSRRIHQRMLTYTLNKIIKTLQVSLFLGFGLVFFGTFVTTPTLVVLLLLANDFVTMSLATDRVRSPRHPERWKVAPLIVSGFGLAVPLVLLSFLLWWLGIHVAHLDVAQMQTLIFVWLVASGQATVYLVRERQHFWHSRPSRWLAMSSAVNLLIVFTLAWRGWLMTSVGLGDLAAVALLALMFLLIGDVLKSPIFRFAGLRL